MTKLKVVPDTNILISAVFWRGNEYKVIKKGLEKEYQLVLSPKIINEMTDKLGNKFDFPENKIKLWTDMLLYFANIVEPTEKLEVVKDDPDDNKIVECAVESNADYIVTGDKHLLKMKKFRNINITNASEFLEKEH